MNHELEQVQTRLRQAESDSVNKEVHARSMAERSIQEVQAAEERFGFLNLQFVYFRKITIFQRFHSRECFISLTFKQYLPYCIENIEIVTSRYQCVQMQICEKKLLPVLRMQNSTPK